MQILRSFVMKGVTRRCPVDLNSVVREGVALGALDASRHGISVALNLSDAVGAAVIDRVQICQVVVNLVRNAVEAMQNSEPRQLTVTTAVASSHMVKITVADTGPGLSSEVERDLFKAFVTFKPGGLGVGLSISRQLVEAHGGRIEAAAGPESGAVFTICLPPEFRILKNAEAI